LGVVVVEVVDGAFSLPPSFLSAAAAGGCAADAGGGPITEPFLPLALFFVFLVSELLLFASVAIISFFQSLSLSTILCIKQINIKPITTWKKRSD
jgi:hypothetical protein